MDIAARVSVIERVPLFRGLGRDELEAVARDGRDLPLAKGEALFRQGDPATHNYIVGWGRLRLDQTTPEGQNVVIRYMGPGDPVGTVALFRGMPFPATPVAVEDCMVLSWDAARFFDHVERFPRIASNAVSLMGARIEELQARLREVATQRVERRIAGTLLRMVRLSGRRVEGGVEIPFPMSRQDLAEMNATTLHTVSRTLAAWEQAGIVSGKRSQHLLILKPHELVRLAEEA